MKNRFGLLDTDIEIIIRILSLHPKVEQAVIFGSRSKGNYKKGSDIDIALKGTNLDFTTLNQVSYELNEEITMPYKFDLLIYNHINEPVLVEHINRVGIEFYNRQTDLG